MHIMKGVKDQVGANVPDDSKVEKAIGYLNRWCEARDCVGGGAGVGSVLVVGPGRAGKSEFARVLASKLNLKLFQLDAIRPIFYDIRDESARLSRRRDVYERILDGCGSGFVVEGLDIVLNNPASGKNNNILNFDLIENLCKSAL